MTLVAAPNPCWNGQSGGDLLVFGHAHEVQGVGCSPDGAYLLAGGLDKPVRMWGAQARAVVREFKGAY